MADFLFGSEPETNTQTLPTATSEQQRLLQQLIGGISPGGQIGGSFGLDPSQIELSSLAALEELVGSIPGAGGPTAEAATGTAQSALEALQGVFESGPTDFDEFFDKTVAGPLFEQFEEDIIPGIRTRFAPQFFGGERAEAERRASGDLIDALAKERARLAFGTRQQDIENKLGAASLTPSLGSFGATSPFIGPSARGDLLLSLLSAGGVNRGIQGSRLDERSRRINQVLGVLGVPTFENVVTSQAGSPGLIPSAIGAFAGNSAIGDIDWSF